MITGETVVDSVGRALPWTAIVLLGACLLAAGAQALMVPATDEDRVADADEIVRGMLTDVRSQWNDDHTHIVTTAKVAVTKRMKGQGPDTFTIAALGGSADGITEWVEDEPVLVPGIEAYFFVRAGSSAGVQALRRAQGIVPITSGRVPGGSLAKGAGIPVAEYDAYLQGLAGGQAMARPRVVEPPRPSTREVAATPVISNITPDTASAGTWTSITITGTGFGTKASRESRADVGFFFASSYDGSLIPIWASGFVANDMWGDPYFGDNANDIVSWSDTRIVVRVPTGIVLRGGVPGDPYLYQGSAGSGPIFVVTDAGVYSAETPFTVTFGYYKEKWDGPAEYYVNPGSLGSEGLSSINTAATSWNTAANPGGIFRFNFAGQSNSTRFGLDGMSLIGFGPGSDFYMGDIAYTYMWYRTGTSIIIEADVELNSGFPWTTGTASGHTMNVERLTLHELGHWLHLADLYGDLAVYGDVPGYPSDTAKTMYGYVNDIVGNKNDLTLHPDDIAGIRWIYPDTVTPRIASIAPSSGSVGSTVPVTITGTGFAADATVTLTRLHSTDIVATSVAVPSASQITCSFAIPETAKPGTWTVVVNLGNRTAVLEDGFTVTAPPLMITTGAFTVPVNGTVDVPIALDRAPYGVRGAAFNVTLSNGACADIVDVAFPAWATDTATDPSPFPGPCDTIMLWMADFSGKAIPGIATNISLGTLKLKGIAGGTTSVVIAPYEDYGIGDHDGETYTVTASPGTVTVIDVPPVAAFGANPPSGTVPLTVTFTDRSTGFVDSRCWTFGDGGTSTATSPTHTFSEVGSYTVTMTVTNTGGSNSTSRTVIATARPWIAADFTANVTAGTAPLTVRFTDASTGSISYRAWEFGDGATSTASSPIHTFTAAGTYTVRLLVSNGQMTDTHRETVTVTAAATLLTIPGAAGLPRDLDGDGLYEDVNGNGRKDFADVILYFNQVSWIAANESTTAFDYNENGRIDFADVLWLFNNL